MSLVAATGFVLLTSLVLNAGISMVRRDFVPFHPVSAVLLHATNFLVQFVAILMLFALMFKVIPDVKFAGATSGWALRSVRFSSDLGK
jgi:membrane protein